MPVEQKGQEALVAAVAKSREVSLDDECTREAFQILEVRAPHLFPALVGEPAEPQATRFAASNGLLLEEQEVPEPREDIPASSALQETIPGLKSRQVAPPPAAGEPRDLREPRSPRSPTAPDYEPPLEGEPDDDDLLL